MIASWQNTLDNNCSILGRARIGDDVCEMGQNLKPIQLGTGLTAKQISIGGSQDHFCVLLDNGSIKCWGNNWHGQLGLDHDNNISLLTQTTGDDLMPVDLGTNRTAIEVSGDGLVGCAILDDNQVKCWGYGRFGSAGQESISDIGDDPGEMGNSLLPVNLGSGRTAKQISTGSRTVCVVLDNNELKCWGLGYGGVLGQGHRDTIGDEPGEMGDSLPAIDLGTGRTVDQVSIGGSHICAILDDETVKCWGSNYWGELGQGHQQNIGDDPDEMGDSLPPVDLGVGRSVKQIAAGHRTTCVILDNHKVKCWENAIGSGQCVEYIGDKPGEMGDNLQILNLGDNYYAKQISGNYGHFCILLDDNTVRCWGRNERGQLGQGHGKRYIGCDPMEMGNNLNKVEF